MSDGAGKKFWKPKKNPSDQKKNGASLSGNKVFGLHGLNIISLKSIFLVQEAGNFAPKAGTFLGTVIDAMTAPKRFEIFS